MIIFLGMMLLLILWLKEATDKAESEARDAELLNKLRESCDMHDWSYHPVTKKLTCTRCGFVAGSE
jgi:hypothetical protein